MWAQKPDLHVSVDRFVLGSKDIFFPINAGSTAHRQVLSSPSSTVEVNNCRGLVHSPLSASSDGSFTASSTQFEDPAALPKYKPNRSSSEIALEKYQSSAAMSGDWWASEEHELSPWRSSVSPQPEASQLVDMEVAEWSSELAALAPDSAFSDQQQTQKQQLDEAINFCDQRIFNYNRDHTFGDSDIVGGVALESLSSCNVGWTSLLLECAGSEAKPNIQNSSAAESLREALYPRQPFDTYTSRLLDLDFWTSFPPQEPYSTGIDSFKFDTMADKIKLEPDVFYGRSNCGIPPQSLSSSQKISPRAENADFHVVQDRELPQLHSFSSKDVPIQWSTSQSSRLPAMLSQVLPSSSSRQSHQAGSTISRLFFDGSSRAEFSPFQRLSDVISFTKHGDHSFASEIKDSHFPLLNRSLEITPAETDKKRAINSAAATSTESTSDPYLKRPRLDPSPSLPFKVRKEKLGEKITALQQLVSPFGKTDTASVLMEAIGYIKFLHEQVQVLSKPYMKSISTSRQNVQEGGKSSWDSDMAKGDGEEPKPDLRSRGLCLVPVSSTQQLANDNGADYWTPAIGGSSR